ncbi:hypothetical protein L249_6072 [Ophiocordyceps polyrhachis-furcata BCC 54312]|uniref:Uncharacterized protein n=1 Tax=Ophiocordyceps polyrhachis-furcata BCC 54312 TaxID=1330021 RepID=A0A367LID1_9HYPO|nr:hypothetical protein L249_6072 [Ophiocordyceps polyrhachis-furcata BCC 54312]
MTSSTTATMVAASGAYLRRRIFIGVRFPTIYFTRLSSSSSSSSSTTDRPIVLEKPTKFNPPSHGSRLRKGGALPRHYAPPLSAAEAAARKQKDYPGVMAPEGSWAHWMWHSRLLHTFITMGALFAMAIATFFLNYTHNSPFKDLVPAISDLWQRPLYFFSAWKNVIILHEKDNSAKAVDHRMAHLDDVAKRRYYMKMHGIEPKDPVSMVFGKGQNKLVETAATVPDMGSVLDVEEKPAQRKKWFGLW